MKSEVRSVICKGNAPVDVECAAKVDVAHVYHEGDDLYDVMLNQTNVQSNNNKYYIIQLLEDDSMKNYSVGVVGVVLGNVGAKNCFERKFFDKTQNQWSDRAHFIKQNRKYDMVEIDYGVKDRVIVPEKKKTKEVKSKLSVAVQILMQLICNMNNMEQVMAELKYDSRRAPLGKLSSSQIRAGYTALDNVSKIIGALSALSQSSDPEKETKSKGRVKRVKANASDKRKLEEQLLSACSDFYTRIPHDFGYHLMLPFNCFYSVIDMHYKCFFDLLDPVS
ncbi:unnamed protein product [Heterobilharzia americana]|nr:unnamed protein product [Heterobilharzia americana]